MKRVLLMVCSICLVLACLFGLFACVGGMKDILNIKDYKEADAELAKEGIATARDGLAQLMENSDVYLEGVDTYQAGLAAYYDGKKQLAAGEAQLAAGRQELAAGQKMIDDNTAAYNEGKELIGKLESFMPLINGIANSAQQVRDFNAGIPLIGATADQALGNLRASVMNLLANSAAVSAISDLVGMDVGSVLASNPTDTTICGNVVAMYNDGLAQLKQYEDGLVALEEGKKQLADGEKELAAGKKQLADGAAQLADGDKQLKQYEDGQAMLADGMAQLMDQMVPCYTRSGEQTVPGLVELLGDDFSLWVKNDDGSIKEERGCRFVDLAACAKVCDEAEHYLELQQADIEGEVYPRIAICALMGIASIIGIISGIVGLVSAITGSKKTGKTGGIITFALALIGNIVGIFTGYTDYVYQTRTEVEGIQEYAYSGDTQFYALIVLAVVSLLFVLAASAAKKAAVKKEAEAKYAYEANQAAAAGAAAAAAVQAADVDDAKLAKLEAENAELKAMVAQLAADIATIKE